MTKKFHQLPVGARFEFRGHRYEKLALSMARDEDRLGNIFHADTEVLPEPETPNARGLRNQNQLPIPSTGKA